jgi:hypothetical protein
MPFRASALISAATVAIAFVLAGCGSSTKTTTVTTTVAATGATTSPATRTGSSTTTVASTSTPSTPTATTTPGTTTPATTTTTAGPSACVAGDLAVSFLGQQGATGHGLLGFALRNTSEESCKTFGYPGIQFLDKAGSPLPTDATRTTHDFFGSAPRVELVLSPGQTASFRVGVLHGVVPNVPCATAYALQVIPPDDTATLNAPIADGAYECKTATVSPLRPGTSAYP